VASGDYTLTFEADDYEPLEIKVRVDKLTKDVRSIALVPVYTEAFDDSIFAEFDTETANDTQSLPSSLSSSKDVFNNIASYKFGEMRFNLRGYDSQYTNVYFNGIRLNDALTGYTPWSLWSGLNDATRNQENTTGLQAADYGLGGIGGLHRRQHLVADTVIVDKHIGHIAARQQQQRQQNTENDLHPFFHGTGPPWFTFF